MRPVRSSVELASPRGLEHGAKTFLREGAVMQRPLLWSVVVAVAAVYGLASPAASDHDDDRDHNRPASQSIHGNAFVNVPCLDPPPPPLERTVQSKTDIAVPNPVRQAHADRDDDDAYDRR